MSDRLADVLRYAARLAVVCDARLLLPVQGMMPDIDPPDEKDHVLGDISGMVGDAFEVTGDKHQVHGCGHNSWP